MSKKPPIRLTDKHFNKTVDEAIRELANENFNQAADAIDQIASWMKSAGVNQEGFMSLFGYIGQSAQAISDNPLLDTKFQEFLKERRIRKQGGAIILNIRR